jgi:hypothetical protein
VRFEDCRTRDNVLEVCRDHGVGVVSDKQLNRPEEEEEVAEGRVTFLDELKGLEMARNYMCHFDVEGSIIIMCNKLENELYILRPVGVGDTY